MRRARYVVSPISGEIVTCVEVAVPVFLFKVDAIEWNHCTELSYFVQGMGPGVSEL